MFKKPKMHCRLSRTLEFIKELNIKVNAYLDLGCGNGFLTINIAKVVRAKEVFGVDIDEGALRQASLRGVKVFICDLNKDSLPFRRCSFDLVTAFEVLEHLINPDNALSEAHRVLKTNGLFVITVPNMASLESRFELLLGRYPYGLEYSTRTLRSHSWFKFKRLKPVGHVRGYTLWALKDLLDYHGFSILEVRGITCRPPRLLNYPLYLLKKMRATFADYLFVVCRKVSRS